MLVGSLFFAGMGTMAHAAAEWCDWQVIAFARCFLVLAFALVLVWWRGVRLVFWKPGILWLRSVAGSCSMVCTFYALTRLPVSDVLTITNMFPIWVALLSWPLLGEAPPRSIWLSVGSGVAGVWLIQQPELVDSKLAVLAAVAASLFTAVAMLGLHHIKGVDARAIVVHFSAVAVVFAVVSFFVFERTRSPHEQLTPVSVGLLLGIGLTATFGQVLLTKAFAAGSPTRVSVVGLTQIVFAMLMDTLLLGHPITVARLLGMVLVVAPTAWLMLYRGVVEK